MLSDRMLLATVHKRQGKRAEMAAECVKTRALLRACYRMLEFAHNGTPVDIDAVRGCLSEIRLVLPEFVAVTPKPAVPSKPVVPS